MSEIRDALRRAKHHAEQLGRHLRNAADAHVYAQGEELGQHLRAAARSQKLLEASHADLEDAINADDPYLEPTHSPPQGPSQTSSGYTQGTSDDPRSAAEQLAERLFSPNRVRDTQLGSCRAAYRARLARLSR